MSILYVTEYPGLGFVGLFSNQHIQAPSASSINAFQTVTLGTSSVTSNAFNANTRLVKLATDTDCCVSYGGSSTATAALGNDYLPAGAVVYYAVSPGSYLAAILATS